ncbi:MAG: hypothetical protein IPQ07_13070 [Myxococcales bacterium]|nr:hypothetical protein [Myxococcales bacterium]
MRTCGLVLVLMALIATMSGAALAQRTCDPAKDSSCRAATVGKPAPKVKPPTQPPTITIGPLDLIGKVRGAMLLQFLERADEELERASLQRRSFVPELVRSVELEAL